MSTYHLTLDKAAITYKDGIYTGAAPEAVWSPFDPNQSSGWQDGDQLVVVCTFDLTPDTTPLPAAKYYAGLAVGACSAGSSNVIQGLINQARSLGYGNKGQLLGDNVTRSDTATNGEIFYDATPEKVTVALTPSSRGTLTNYKYKWTMTYNGNNNIVSGGDDVEIVFGYGDPHVGDQDS